MIGNSEKHLNLCLPDWQGWGNDRRPEHGARALRDAFSKHLTFVDIPIVPGNQLHVEHDILGHSAIVSQLRAAREVVAAQSPTTIFTVGGTCGVDVIPVSYLNQLYPDDLVILWFDAHGDLNSPASSRSKHFHGMPVRTLLGEGDTDIRSTTFSIVKPHQVFLIGCRDLDSPERHFIETHCIAMFTPTSLTDSEGLCNALKSIGAKHVYIHFDFDVLDPTYFKHILIPVPNGLTPGLAKKIITDVRREANVVGLSMIELNPIDDSWFDDVQDLYRTAMGSR